MPRHSHAIQANQETAIEVEVVLRRVLLATKWQEKCLAAGVDKAVVEKVADTFKMVYTPFHGCGYKLVPEALKRAGKTNEAAVLQAKANKLSVAVVGSGTGNTALAASNGLSTMPLYRAT